MTKNKIPTSIALVILTAITITIWVGTSIYRALISKPSPAVSGEILKTFSPTLNQKAIQKIEGRSFLLEEEIGRIAKPITLPTVAPTPTPLPIPTQTPVPEATEKPQPT